MNEKRNHKIFLRPRFKIEVLKDSEYLLLAFKKKLKNSKFKGKIAHNHIFIDIAKEENRFWSPQLQLEIERISKNKTHIKGLFGPKPQLWTFFMFIHFLVATAFIGFSIMLYVQNTLKNNITLPLTMVLLAPIIWFVLYFVGQYAKRKARNQMFQLHKFVVDIVEEYS